MVEYPKQLENQAANLLGRIMRRLLNEGKKKAIQKARAQAVAHDEDFLDEFLKKLGIPVTSLTQSEVRALERIAKSADEHAKNQAARVIEEMKKNVKDPLLIGLTEEALLRENLTAETLKSFVRENMTIIKNAAVQGNIEIENALVQGLKNGYSAKTIAKNIRKIADVSESYAKFVARDQTGSLLSTIQTRRYQAAGFPGYIWDATMDSRTRPSHAANHGKYFKFGDVAPGLSKPTAKEPGDDYNCVMGHHHVGHYNGLKRTFSRVYKGEMIVIRLKDCTRDIMITPNHPVLAFDPEWNRTRWIKAGELLENHLIAFDESTSGTENTMQVQQLADYGKLDGEYELARQNVPHKPEDFHGDGAGSSTLNLRHAYKMPEPRFDPGFLDEKPRRFPRQQFEFRPMVELIRTVTNGPVYNFETGHGWYTVNGIVVHNCRCTKIPSWGPQEQLSPEERQDAINRINKDRAEFGKEPIPEEAVL